MVVCVECLPADKPWDVVPAKRQSSGVAPRACVRVYARVLVPPNLYLDTQIPARMIERGEKKDGGCRLVLDTDQRPHTKHTASPLSAEAVAKLQRMR